MAKKATKTYDTSQDTFLGSFFRRLLQSNKDPIDPSQGGTIQAPALPDVSSLGIDPAALEEGFKSYGSGSNLYVKLAGLDSNLAKDYSDAFNERMQFDNAMSRYNKLDAANRAVLGGNATMGNMGTILGEYWRQQPMLGKAAGIGLGLGNLGGLVDNDKFGGQLGGLALGGLGSKMLMDAGMMSNPGAAALLTMGGGQLGALFDKLRAKREGQRQQISQQQMRR